MEAPKKSLAELRAEVKQIRKELYKPISRSKKGELEAEIARHKGITSSTFTKVEQVEEAKPEKKTKPKKAEPKKAEPKKEEKKVKETKKKEVAKKEKKKD